MKKFCLLLFWMLTCTFAGQGTGHASLIAQYTFDDFTVADSSGSVPSYNLGIVGAAPNLYKQAYYSDGNPDNYLEVAGPGGMPDWTLSLWVNTLVLDQGDYRALFSNFDSSLAGKHDPYSFQIDSHFGTYRLLSEGDSPFTIGTPTVHSWENIIVQKIAGSNAAVYFNGLLVGALGGNPGGLQNFRLGVNRNSNRSFLGYLDNVQVWDDSNQVAADIYAAGAGVNKPLPEPSTLVLLGCGLLGAWGWTRRRR